jgi:Dullard-like phosphatase family protein
MTKSSLERHYQFDAVVTKDPVRHAATPLENASPQTSEGFVRQVLCCFCRCSRKSKLSARTVPIEEEPSASLEMSSRPTNVTPEQERSKVPPQSSWGMQEQQNESPAQSLDPALSSSRMSHDESGTMEVAGSLVSTTGHVGAASEVPAMSSKEFVTQARGDAEVQPDDEEIVAQRNKVKADDRPCLFAPFAFLPPQDERVSGRKCLVLDLDETLVHSAFTKVSCEIVLDLNIANERHKVYVKKRPGVDEFLKVVSQWFEVVIFTASTSLYANPLIDKLDIYGAVDHRLFRDSCTRYRAGYVKDLSKLGRNLEDVIIIDNSPVCYALQPENAIPIKTWRDDPLDTELLDLLPILVYLSRVDDIPSVLRDILSEELCSEGEPAT